MRDAADDATIRAAHREEAAISRSAAAERAIATVCRTHAWHRARLEDDSGEDFWRKGLIISPSVVSFPNFLH